MSLVKLGLLGATRKFIMICVLKNRIPEIKKIGTYKKERKRESVNIGRYQIGTTWMSANAFGDVVVMGLFSLRLRVEDEGRDIFRASKFH